MTKSVGWAVDRGEFSINFPIVSLPGMPSLKRVKGWVTPETWCEEFYKRLTAVMPIQNAWKFNENGVIKVYAIIDTPSTENILKLSEVYCAFLAEKIDKEPESYFEFLVFGKDEIDEAKLSNCTCIRRND